MTKLLSACLFLSFWSARAGAQTISGEVTAPSGGGVPGVTVELLNGNASAVSDSAGRYVIPLNGAGSFALRFSKAGYASGYRYVRLPADTAGGQMIRSVLRPEGAALDEVLVRADKKDALLQQTPVSATVWSGSELEAQRVWNISELTGLAPALYAADPGDNRTVISLRGVATTSYDPAVAVYIDGVNQFGLDTYLSDLLEPDHVEVLRGPQSTLYGRNAMGGVINITTKQPSARPAASGEISLGNYGLQRYRAGFTAPLSRRLLLGASLLYSRTGGFYTNTYDDSRFDRQSAFSGNYFLKYLSGARWTVTLNAKHRLGRNHGAFPLVNGLGEALADPFRLSQNAAAVMNDRTLNGSLTVKYAGRKVQLVSETGYQDNRRIYDAPLDGDFSPVDGISIYNDYGGRWNNVRALTQELRISSAGGGARSIDWVAGAYGFYQTSPVKQATLFGRDAGLLGVPDPLSRVINTSEGTSKGIAFFGQISVPVTERLRLTGGLRYDYQQAKLSVRSDYLSDSTGTAFPILADTSGKGHYSALSPRAGIAYRLSDRHMIYVNYSRGFRTGGLTQIGPDPSQPALSPFDPEYSDNVELGLKQTFLQGRLRLNLAAFYTHVHNLQLPTLVLPAAITVTRNTGALDSRGAEAELSALPLQGLEVRYSFGYTHARYTSLILPQDGKETDYAGNRQLFTPEVTSMLAVQYRYPLSRVRQLELFVHGAWHYLGRQYFDQANKLEQAPYHLVHLRLGVRYRRSELAFWSRNLGDTRYVDYAYDFGAAHLGDPRTYGMTLTLRTD